MKTFKQHIKEGVDGVGVETTNSPEDSNIGAHNIDMKNVLEHNVNQYKLLRSNNNELTTYPKAFHNMDFNYIGVDKEERLKQHYRIEEHETL